MTDLERMKSIKAELKYRYISYSNLHNDDEHGCKVIEKAIDYRIPKKPICKSKNKNGRYENCNVVMCPTCNKRLKLKSKGKCCDKCGQAIDWKGVE